MPFPGQKTPRGPFPARPTPCHNSKFPQYPRFILHATTPTSIHPSPSPLSNPLGHVHSLRLPNPSRRTNGHSRSYSVGNLISYPAPQSPGTRTLPRGSPLPPIPPMMLMTMPSTMPTLFSLLLLLYPHFASSHLFHSLPDDLYSFPKHRVTFLNGLPLLNETAERWLREGLRGGEAEFLDNPTPWQEPSPFKHIDAGEGAAVCS